MTAALQPLLEHCERQRDDMLLALQRAEAHARRLQQQADQLGAYRADYERRGPTQAGRSSGMDVVNVHTGFIGRLGQALEQHQGQQQGAEAQVQRLRAALLPLELRVAAVRKLLERRDLAQRGVESRREQRQTDEAAQQLLWRAAVAQQASSLG
jgi:flagellar FliJ protein